MKIKTYTYFLTLLSIVILFQACELDPAGGGNGINDDVSKFLGTWNVSDQSARLNYKVVIERDPVYAEQVYLQNFADAGGKAIGLVIGDKIIIDKQQIGNGYSTEGEGVYNKSNQLTFEFVLDDGIDLDPRKGYFTK
jgi:hypothetical protein